MTAPVQPWQGGVAAANRTVQNALAGNAAAALGFGGDDNNPALDPDEQAGTVLLPLYYAWRDPRTNEFAFLTTAQMRNRNKGWNPGPENELHEQFAGGVVGEGAELIFPHISTCIGVACALRNKVTGAHLSLATEEAAVNGLLHIVRRVLNSNADIRQLYVFGPREAWAKFTKFKEGRSTWKTPGFDGAVHHIKSELGYGGRVLVADQPHGSKCEYKMRIAASAVSGVQAFRAMEENGAYGAYAPIDGSFKEG